METHAYVQWRKFFKSPNNGFKRETGERYPEASWLRKTSSEHLGAAGATARITFVCARARPSPRRVCALAHTHPSQTCGQKRLRALPAARLHTACAHGDMRTHAPRTCEPARRRACALLPPTYPDQPSLRVDTCAPRLARVDASAKNYAELLGGAVP